MAGGVWHPLGLIMGPILFNSFLNNFVDRIENIFRKFTKHIKLRRAADKLEESLTSGEILLRWRNELMGNSWRFSNGNCRVLHLGWSNPMQEHAVGSSSAGKDLGSWQTRTGL